MAVASWDSIIVANGGYFASTADLQPVAVLAERLFGTGKGQQALLDAKVSCKADLKERIILKAQGVYPDCVAYYKNVYDRAQRGNAPATDGVISISGAILNATTAYTDTPYVFLNAGTPTTQFNGSALNGQFCWDTTNNIIYVNRGTTATNDWDVFTSADLVNYIDNPTVLKTAFMYGVKYYLFEQRTGAAGAINEPTVVDAYIMQEERYCKKYEMYAKNAIQQINFDYANNGTVNSLGKQSHRTTWGMR